MRTTAVGAVEQQVRGLGLVDAWRWMHGERRAYTYHPRGRPWGSSCDRVDLVLVSRGLVDGERGVVKEVGILESVKERGPSDHVPIYVGMAMGKG
jgi:exonuclease III